MVNGVSYNYTNTDNDTRQDKLTGGEFVMDPKQTNHFIYKENILEFTLIMRESLLKSYPER